jgi:hypothetical protein
MQRLGLCSFIEKKAHAECGYYVFLVTVVTNIRSSKQISVDQSIINVVEGLSIYVMKHIKGSNKTVFATQWPIPVSNRSV